MDLIAQPKVRAMRELIGDGLFADTSVVPHFEEIGCILANRCITGTSDGLPIAITPVRQIDMRGAQKSELDEQIDLFLRCNIEQRALVLHNLSMQQQRMVKFVEVRDLNAVWISEIVNKGRALLARVKKLMGTVQDFYPEVVHRVLIAHTPAAFSTLYAITSPVLISSHPIPSHPISSRPMTWQVRHHLARPQRTDARQGGRPTARRALRCPLRAL
jgi:hypothetical protein